jgi:hypothetical protein
VGLLHGVHVRGDRVAVHVGWRGKQWALAKDGSHGRRADSTVESHRVRFEGASHDRYFESWLVTVDSGQPNPVAMVFPVFENRSNLQIQMYYLAKV